MGSAVALGSLRERRELAPVAGKLLSKAVTLTSRAQVLGLAPLSHYLQAFKNTPENSMI